MRSIKLPITLTMLASLAAPGCKSEKAPQPEAKPAEPAEKPAPPIAVPEAPPVPAAPRGLEELELTPHDHNPTTPDKVALGEVLFFDMRLSDSNTYACVTCHLPEKGWTDGKALSPKHNGEVNKRHSPTLYNVGYALDWYWDGREKTLESQIRAAWAGQTGGTPEKVAEKLAKVPEYKARFQKAFGEDPTPDNIPKALAAFLRIKLRAGDTPWDRYKAGDASPAVKEDAIKGEAVFLKAGCAVCHAPPLYTDMKYHNIGVGYKGVEAPDVGRFKVTQNEAETGAFKTPTLRGVGASAPYFHDGSAATLDEAVDFMLAGGHRENNAHIDPLLKPVELSAEERAQLLAFLRAITPDLPYKAPRTP